MLLKSLLLFFVGSLNVLIGLLVIARDYKKLQNKMFFLLSFGLGGWVIGIGGFLLAQNSGVALGWAKAYYTFPLILCSSMALFSRSFPNSSKIPKSWWIPVIGGLIFTVVPLLLFKTYLTSSLQYHDWGKEIVLNKTHYLMYSVYLMGCFIFGLAHIFLKSRKLQGFSRQQARYFFVGFLLTSSFGVLFNLFYPWFGNYRWIWLGPLFTNTFIIATGYSIIRHRLFDIRAVAARSLAYLLSVLTVAIIYGIIAFSVMNQFIVNSRIMSFSQKAAFTLLAVGIAFTYQPLKKFFDKVTNKFFFRDAYEIKDVIDKLGEVIVGNVDHHKIQKGALNALSSALKPSYITFLLLHSNGKLTQGDLVGQQWNMHNPTALQSTLKRKGKKITSYDELEDSGGSLVNTLRVEDISIVAPLATKEEVVGYMILGAKKSGNMYNTQDIGLLTTATNELAVALQNAQRFEEIQAFNITLQQKITDATRELKQSNKKLIALDEAKDEFISMASHQLRTPLTSIKGYISMILEEDLGKVNPAQEKALKEAFGSSQRMVYLIADFLNVSRIKTGKFMIEPKEIDLPEIVREELTQLREMAGSRDLTLKYDQPEVFPRVKLDDNKIRQVMMNMVDNAIYYTPSGGTITIQLYSTGDEVIFKVVDSGIGVPKAEQHKLFTKFYRAGNARKSRPDGTGLGLFMAQKIVVEQGGAIIFESEEGKGSTFGWRFPLSKIKV